MNQRKVEKALKKKGFEEQVSGHHKFYYFEPCGVTTSVFTKTSHASKEQLSASLVGKMARQLKIDKQQFKNLVNCPLSMCDYIAILQVAGIQVSADCCEEVAT